MFENKYPIFKRGELIDKKELDLLRDNPEEMLKLMYMDRKNGIIKGFEIISDTKKKGSENNERNCKIWRKSL